MEVAVLISGMLQGDVWGDVACPLEISSMVAWWFVALPSLVVVMFSQAFSVACGQVVETFSPKPAPFETQQVLLRRFVGSKVASTRSGKTNLADSKLIRSDSKWIGATVHIQGRNFQS